MVDEGYIRHKSSTEWDSRYDYICGHCGKSTSGRVVSTYQDPHNQNIKYIRFLICTSCDKGSVWNEEKDQILPAAMYGDKLQGLPNGVNDAYNESRVCLSVGLYTSCELMCRKILMHVAVEKGAKEGEKFEYYLNYLESKGYITPPIKKWADIIRKNGNAATHKLEPVKKDRAENTFMFTMELLKIIYEMEYIAKTYSPVDENNEDIAPIT